MKRLLTSTAALGLLVASAALATLVPISSGAAPLSPAARVEFVKSSSDQIVRVGDTLTFTLVAYNTSDEALQVRIADPNPTPAHLRILTGTITGGAQYSPSIDGVVWEGPLGVGAAPELVAFQMLVTGIPAPVNESHLVVNRATLADMAVPGSLPEATAEAMISIEPWRAFAPLVSRHDVCAVPVSWASPFSIQIAALHEVVERLDGRRVARPMTEAEWLAAYDEAFPTLVAALADSGAAWSRVYVNWSWIQPEAPPADYVWGPYHDEKLRLVAEAGVQLIGTVAEAPAWAADEPCAPIYCGPDCGDRVDRLDEFAQFLTDLVNRYKQPPYNIKHWEMFNEPDSTWSGIPGAGCWADENTHQDGYAYAQMMATAHPAIKAADPEATILMGGVAHDWFTEVERPFDRYFPDDMMTYGTGDHIDALNIHYFPDYHREWVRWDPRSNDQRYGWIPAPTCGDLFDGQGETYDVSGIDVIAKTSHFRNRMKTCFGVDRPIWMTEMADHGNPSDPNSLAQQARYVVKGYTRGLAAGVENITWFALATNDGLDQELLYDDWTPKPSYHAFQALTSELAGYEYSHERGAWVYDDSEVGFTYVREAYVFENACQWEKTVAWASGTVTDTLRFAPARQLSVVDRWGTMTYVEDGGEGDIDCGINGEVELQLSPDPVFVTVTAP